MASQHIYCGRVWNLIQDCDVQSSDKKVNTSTPPSPEVENFQIKIYCPARDRTLDPMNQRQTYYHLSQHGESKLVILSMKRQNNILGYSEIASTSNKKLNAECNDSSVTAVKQACMPTPSRSSSCTDTFDSKSLGIWSEFNINILNLGTLG